MSTPVFNYPNSVPTKPGLYLCLFSYNGEDGKSESGPCIGPLRYCHTTYGTDIKLEFKDASDRALFANDGIYDTLMELAVNKEDCIVWQGKEFSDWSVACFPVE